MKRTEYLRIQTQLAAIAAVVSELDLDGFLEAIEKAKAAGPVLDPTLYRRSHRQLEKVESVARAAKELKEAAWEGLPHPRNAPENGSGSTRSSTREEEAG